MVQELVITIIKIGVITLRINLILQLETGHNLANPQPATSMRHPYKREKTKEIWTVYSATCTSKKIVKSEKKKKKTGVGNVSFQRIEKEN